MIRLVLLSPFAVYAAWCYATSPTYRRLRAQRRQDRQDLRRIRGAR